MLFRYVIQLQTYRFSLNISSLSINCLTPESVPSFSFSAATTEQTHLDWGETLRRAKSGRLRGITLQDSQGSPERQIPSDQVPSVRGKACTDVGAKTVHGCHHRAVFVEMIGGCCWFTSSDPEDTEDPEIENHGKELHVKNIPLPIAHQ